MVSVGQEGEVPPLHDVYEDKEVIIPEPGHANEGDSHPMILVTEVDELQTGSDAQNGKVQDGEQNGDSYVGYSVTDDDGDVLPPEQLEATEKTMPVITKLPPPHHLPDGNEQVKE